MKIAEMIQNRIEAKVANWIEQNENQVNRIIDNKLNSFIDAIDMREAVSDGIENSLCGYDFAEAVASWASNEMDYNYAIDVDELVSDYMDDNDMVDLEDIARDKVEDWMTDHMNEVSMYASDAIDDAIDIESDVKEAVQRYVDVAMDNSNISDNIYNCVSLAVAKQLS